MIFSLDIVIDYYLTLTLHSGLDDPTIDGEFVMVCHRKSKNTTYSQ